MNTRFLPAGITASGPGRTRGFRVGGPTGFPASGLVLAFAFALLAHAHSANAAQTSEPLSDFGFQLAREFLDAKEADKSPASLRKFLDDQGVGDGPLAKAVVADVNYLLVDEFLGQAETEKSSSGLKQYLATQGYGSGDSVDGATTLLQAMQDVLGQGVKLDSPAFKKMTAGLGASVVGNPGADLSPAVAPSWEEAKALGERELKQYPKAQKIYYATQFGVEFKQGEKWADFEKTKACDDEYGSFLAKFGGWKPVAKKTAVPKSASEGDSGSDPVAAPPPAKSQTSEGPGASVANQQGGDKPSATLSANMRDYGISFSQGFGVGHGAHHDAGLAVLIVRVNLLQERSTIKWNQLVARSDRTDGQYKKINYYGNRGWALVKDYVGPDDEPDTMRSVLQWRKIVPTAVGPFFGGGVLGDKFDFGHNADGTLRSERPYLAGLSVGWGFINGGGSEIYVDVGATLSPTTGFAYSRPYFGVSIDGELFGAIIDYIRKTKPAS